MSIATPAIESAAAAALAGLLPSSGRLVAEPAPAGSWAGLVRSAVVASFVGGTSAETAVVFADAAEIAASAGLDGPALTVVDVLRPALEGATAQLGAGVLDDARLDDASALFGHAETTVFRLVDGVRTAGWFAIRVRAPHAAPGAVSSDPFSGKLNRINSVEMSLTVEIGRSRMSVRDVLSLEPGGVVELDRAAGAPADVLLNGRLIAHGEIVVVDQDYAVRITEILDVADGLA